MKRITKQKSPAKPEKIYVLEALRDKNNKWYTLDFEKTLPMAKVMLKDEQYDCPNDKFHLREYTAGKVLKD